VCLISEIDFGILIYLSCRVGHVRDSNFNVNLNNFQRFFGSIKCGLLGNSHKRPLLKFCRVIGTSVLVRGSERWVLTREQVRKMETAETRSFRAVAGYRMTIINVVKIIQENKE
jgi:hypothetical protein